MKKGVDGMLKNELLPTNSKISVVEETYSACMHIINRDLDKMIECYVLDSNESYFKCYSEHLNWVYSSGNWDSISVDLGNRVLAYMKTLLNKEHTNREIADLIMKEFSIKTIKMSLDDNDFRLRHQIVAKLVFNFHPDSTAFKSQNKNEQKKRENLFKTEISDAIQTVGIEGLNMLEELEKKFNL